MFLRWPVFLLAKLPRRGYWARGLSPASVNRPVIFISAVSRELRTARDLVAKTLIALGYEPKWQDIAPTETGDLRAVLRKWADDSAGVIQLVGHCYGFGPAEPDADFGQVSYTQYEALYARQRGKPVWYILLGEAHEKDGCGCDPASLHQLQDAYRAKLQATGELYHPSDSLLKTESIILKLREDLADIRAEWEKEQRHARRFRVLAGIGILLLLGIGIAVKKDAVQTGKAVSQVSGKVDVQQQTATRTEEKVDAMLAAMRDLPGTLGKQSPAKNPQDETARLASAYAELEKQHHLPSGTLEKELPKFAEQLLARADSSAFDRASALFATKKFAEAEAAALAAKDHALAAAGKPVQDAIAALELAGDAAREQIHYREALDHFRAAAALTDEKRDPREWARVQHNIAIVLYDTGAYPEAESTLRAAVAVRERVLGAEHADTLLSRNWLSNALDAQGRHVEAEQEQRAVLAIRERVLGPENLDTMKSRNNLAFALQEQGKNDEARQEFQIVLANMERAFGAEHPDTLSVRSNLAFTLQEQGRNAEAEKEHRAVLAIRERVLGTEHPDVFESCYKLALCLEAQRKFPEAVAFMQRAETGFTKVLGQEHPRSKDAKRGRERIKGAMRKP